MMKLINSVWKYRGFIIGSVKRDFQFKYQNSLLGILWIILQPLSMILVYTLIFSQLMHAKFPGSTSSLTYSIYLCSGILAWGLFSEITTRATNTFIDNANILKKISFPRICLPIIVMLNAGLNFLIIFGLFTIFLLVSGNFPGISYLAVIPLLIILAAFAIGLGISFGVLNVFFRDFGQFFSIFLQFWFWLTPIVYLKSILPDWAQTWIAYNPMEPVISGFQQAIAGQVWPNWVTLFYPVSIAVIACSIAAILFSRHIGDMMDEL
jgi:lipopolysaccharide transport system permease protein